MRRHLCAGLVLALAVAGVSCATGTDESLKTAKAERATTTAAAPTTVDEPAPTTTTSSTSTTIPPTTPTTQAPPPPPPPTEPPPAPPAFVAPPLPAGGCDPNYTGCVPIASDVDCAGGSGNGPAYVSGPVQVIGSDIYGLDSDGDGIGCEQD
jgi:hypothetical protein